MNAAELASELRELRVHAGLTQPELASRMRIAVSTVTHIERARRQPGLDVLRKWLAACGGTLMILGPAQAGAEDPLAALTAAVRPLPGERLRLVERFAKVAARLDLAAAERELYFLEVRAGLVAAPALPEGVGEPPHRLGTG